MLLDLDNLEYRELLLSNGYTKYFIVANGVCYQYATRLKDGTYEERDKADMARVIEACEYARNDLGRIRLWYGDVNTGRSWNEEYDVTGYIAKTLGNYNIPILINNARSLGGRAIFTDCIVRLDYTKTGKTLYKHPKFYVEPMEIRDVDDLERREAGYVASIYIGPSYESAKCVRFCKSKRQAENWIKFMNGERYCK